MATESVPRSALVTGRKVSRKLRAEQVSRAANTAYLDLFQVRSIAQMLNDHHEVGKADFPDDVSGGILAILSIATGACERLEKDL